MRQSREHAKQSSAHVDENILCDTGATGQSGVTQLQCRTPTGGHLFFTPNIYVACFRTAKLYIKY